MAAVARRAGYTLVLRKWFRIAEGQGVSPAEPERFAERGAGPSQNPAEVWFEREVRIKEHP